MSCGKAPQSAGIGLHVEVRTQDGPAAVGLGPAAVPCLFFRPPTPTTHFFLLVWAVRICSRQLDPSARSQYRAISYRQISARIGHAVAEASVGCLLGVPSLPLLPFIPRDILARNCPGPADSFSV